MLVVNCETDFVAQNAEFNTFATTILDAAIANSPASIDALKALKFTGEALTIGEKIIEQTGVIGEKIDVTGYEVVEAEHTIAYNHPGNRLASIVALNKTGETVDEAGRQVAMQIAAMDPIAIDESGVSPEVIEKEKALGREIAEQEGKPEAMLDKIAEGKVKKFLKDNTLLNQASVRDNKKTVSQYLNETENGLTVTDFKRIMLG